MAGSESTIGALLDETGGSIKTGPFGTKLKASEYTATGVPVISVGEVGFGRLRIHHDTPRVDETVSSRMPEFLLKAGDIVFGRKGAVERSAQVQPGEEGYFLGSDGIRIRLNVEDCDPKFISYQLQTKAHRNWMIQHAAGTTMPSLNEGIIRRIPIVLKPLAEQKAIAAVLGALDDKIELNRRMNATLEAMARALFQSWFVDFDPVRAKMEGRQPAGMNAKTAALFPAAFQDSSIGHIPMGWGIQPLAEAFNIKDGATFRKEDRIETGTIIAFGANGPVGLSTRANVSEPCISLGKIGSCGSLHRSWNPCWVTNNAFIVKPHRDGSLEFVWRTLCMMDFSQFIGGSANPYMPLKNFGHTPVVMPPTTLLSAYQERAGSLAAKVVANDEQSRTLATLRDTLLPKLLSGELSVKEANPEPEAVV
jgi:type I restriction enzyme S subunit